MTLVSLRTETPAVATRVSVSKWVQSTNLDLVNEVSLKFMCVGSWGGVTYLRYTVLMSPKRDKIAVAILLYRFLSSLVSQNVFYVESALQFIVCLKINVSIIIRTELD